MDKRFVTNTGAIMKRELSGYFRSPVAYVFICIFLLLSGFFTFMVSRFYESEQADLRGFFEWHPWLFSNLREVAPKVGSKACFEVPGDLQAIVAEGLARGEIAFPEPTAHVVVPGREGEETKAVEQETERAA